MIYQTKPKYLSERILEYIKDHPGCRRIDVEMALDILALDFMDARKVLGDKIVARKDKSSEAHYFAV